MGAHCLLTDQRLPLIAVPPICRCGPNDVVEHRGEDQTVKRIDEIPVGQASKADGIEGRCLSDRCAVFGRLHLEFQPGAPGQLHFSAQPQESVGLKSLNPPEVERVADVQCFRIQTPAARSDTTHEQVQETSKLP